MFLCYISSQSFFARKSLPINANKQMSIKSSKGTSLCTRKISKKGSLTLESAIVMPLTVFFLTTLLFLFRVLAIETEVYVALNYASRQTAAMSSTLQSKATCLAMAETLFYSKLSKEENASTYLSPATRVLMLSNSTCTDSHIDLVADYRVNLPIAFFTVKDIHIRQESISRKWTGAPPEGEETEGYVYVTEYGTVYHLTKNCSYLDLSIQTAKLAEIEGLRNLSGHKYYACERCVAKNTLDNTIYITDFGDAYHASLECSGLKRTVYVVKQSEAENKKACSKCAKSKK